MAAADACKGAGRETGRREGGDITPVPSPSLPIRRCWRPGRVPARFPRDRAPAVWTTLCRRSAGSHSLLPAAEGDAQRPQQQNPLQPHDRVSSPHHSEIAAHNSCSAGHFSAESTKPPELAIQSPHDSVWASQAVR